MTNCIGCINQEKNLAYALESIIWYDGHYKWLKELRDVLEKWPEDKNFCCPIDTEYWHTEGHVIWMLLVGMFGDWGTSIRGGWIEDKKECIEFINQICKEAWEHEH